jgi:L-iditol 2-dehydrogenase
LTLDLGDAILLVKYRPFYKDLGEWEFQLLARKYSNMKALILKEYYQFSIEDVPTPTPGPTDVLVRIKSTAICGSDVHGYDGTSGRRIPPIIMGHEAAGQIEKVGAEVTPWHTGDRVTFDSTIFPLDDWYTRRGWYNLSNNRKVLGVSCEEYRQNGTFAEYTVVPQHILYRLPDSLSYDHAAITEPLAVALHGVSLTPIAIGDTVAVIGAGTIGLLILASLKQRGCANIVVSDTSDERLEIARKMGATHTINPEHDSLSQICTELTDGRGADSILEAVGLEVTINDAIASLRRGGTLILVGNISKQVSVPLQRIVAGQIRLQGSCAIREEFPTALQLLEAGKIPTELIISKTAFLEQAPEIFKRLHAGDPKLLKVILHP